MNFVGRKKLAADSDASVLERDPEDVQMPAQEARSMRLVGEHPIQREIMLQERKKKQKQAESPHRHKEQKDRATMRIY